MEYEKKVVIGKEASVLDKCSETKNAKLHRLMDAIRNQINLNALVPAFIEALSEIDEFRITAKKLSSRGKIGLEQLTAIETQLSLFDELRSNRLPKGLDGYDAGKGKTHVLSYYKAKGREFDFVVMIVDPTRGESDKVPLDEKRRLYYVCATRATRIFVPAVWVSVAKGGMIMMQPNLVNKVRSILKLILNKDTTL